MKTIHFLNRHTLFFILSVVVANRGIASDMDTTNTSRSIIISYWGTLNNNPGLKVGVEKTRSFTSKYAVGNSLSLLINRKPDLYTSAGVILNSSLRITGKRGFYFDHTLNFGYLGSYYDFDFYRTNADNQIVNVGRKWVGSIILGYSIGLGYDFSKKTSTDLQLFIKPGIYYRLPNNDNIFFLNNYTVEVGVAFHPKLLNKEK